ncbi:MAG: flavodoxin, partial [Pseudomonadota bacterium]|nr:flavodoxin [Pseudomonadota bacterium]
MRILIAFSSLSGNTRDVARAIRAHCEALGHSVTWIEADVQTLAGACPQGAVHELYVLG